MKKLEKPTMVVSQPYWDYHQVIHYIEEKYNIDVRDYFGKHLNENNSEKIKYLNFWHWILSGPGSEINNGSFFYLDIDYYLKDKNIESWVKEILQMIKDEFNVSEMRMWVEW